MIPETDLNSVERLGYPPDARLLIINVDDFGMCHAINEATVQAITQGIATSCSIMAPCPWGLYGLEQLKANPDIPFGVHLTAISEQPHYRWGSLAPPHQVTSLLDEAGYFYAEHRMEDLLQKARLTELETEFRTQIEWVLASGLAPTHLDSHCGVHVRREDIFDLVFGLAREYDLGLRVGHLPLIKQLQAQGYPTDNYPVLDSYRLPTEDKVAAYIQRLRELPPGLSEWATHPAIANAELKAIVPSWAVRGADFEFLMSSEAARVMAEEGIIRLDYRLLQAAWQVM